MVTLRPIPAPVSDLPVAGGFWAERESAKRVRTYGLCRVQRCADRVDHRVIRSCVPFRGGHGRMAEGTSDELEKNSTGGNGRSEGVTQVVKPKTPLDACKFLGKSEIIGSRTRASRASPCPSKAHARPLEGVGAVFGGELLGFRSLSFQAVLLLRAGTQSGWTAGNGVGFAAKYRDERAHRPAAYAQPVKRRRRYPVTANELKPSSRSWVTGKGKPEVKPTPQPQPRPAGVPR